MYFRLFVLTLVLATSSVAAQPARPLAGRTVQSVVDELRAAGAPLVYSSGLLPSTLVVMAEPVATAPLELAREVLAPHGLAVREEGGAWLVVRAEELGGAGGVVLEVTAAYVGTPIASFEVAAEGPTSLRATGAGGRAELERIPPGRYAMTVRAAGYLPERVSAQVTAGATATVTVALVEAVAKLEELVVTASRYDVANDVQPSAAYFSRAEVENLPLLGDDTLRVAQRLPGVTGNGFSARPYVRGGAADEVAVLLDGVRLAEPYHLRDFQSVFSAVDQRIVDHVAVHAGGFPAEYGDALSGLIAVEVREPAELRHELGLSVLYTSVLSSGTFAGGRASWLVSGRDSNLDRVLADELGEPAFSDVFARVGADLGARHRLAFGGLRFDDDVQLRQADPEGLELGTSDTDSRQAWLRLDSDWSDDLASSMWLTATSVTSRRRADVAVPNELIGSVDDRRSLDAIAVKQRWQYSQSDRQLLRFGLEAESRDADFRYAAVADRRGLLATLGGPESLARAHASTVESETLGLYVEDRVQLAERWIADLGLRWDRQSHLPAEEKDRFGPRLSLLARLDDRTDLRLSHGRFFQAESLLDLQVEDGVTVFWPAQRAVHSVVGLDRRLAGTIALRAEWYRKRTRQVRPRFENLFEPLVIAPELRSSRVLVAPERAEADGLELTISGEAPASWWIGVSLANADDHVAGAAVPRAWDQERAVNAGVTWPAGRWTVSAAATIHRGWPATELRLVTGPNGEPAVVAGPRNVSRLPSVRRLDFRLSRDYALGDTALRFFAEITNLTNRDNPCCLAYAGATLSDGSAALVQELRSQGGVTGNVGLLWQF